jgi:hypothetical protein
MKMYYLAIRHAFSSSSITTDFDILIGNTDTFKNSWPSSLGMVKSQRFMFQVIHGITITAFIIDFIEPAIF